MRIQKLLFGVLLLVIDWLFFPLYLWRSYREKKYIAPVNDEILKISAKSLARKIRKKEVTCMAVIEAYINRMKQVNGVINAVLEERMVEAIKEAIKIDQYIASEQYNEDEMARTKPLLGIPMTVKESCGIGGYTQCGCSLTRVGRLAEKDGEAVARLREAGAIPVLITNTPEFCLGMETYNLIKGFTRNPYDSNRTAGGSSGGEGALLGAGASLIGVGSDIAGSIRIPAMFNGIFGHKPSPGLIPLKGHYLQLENETLVSYLSIGPMTRYAEDLALLMNVMCGKEILNIHDEHFDFSKIRLFKMDEKYYPRYIQKEIRKVMKDCYHHLQMICNPNIGPIQFPKMYKFAEMAEFYICDGIMKKIDLLHDYRSGDLTRNIYVEIVKYLLGISDLTRNPLICQYALSKDVFEVDKFSKTYFAQVEQAKKNVNEVLGENGILLFPTFHRSAPYHRGSELFFYNTLHTVIFNVLGLPSTHVPMGLDKNNLPIGVQVVAGPNQDYLCLAVARELEKRFGGWVPPS